MYREQFIFGVFESLSHRNTKKNIEAECQYTLLQYTIFRTLKNICAFVG